MYTKHNVIVYHIIYKCIKMSMKMFCLLQSERLLPNNEIPLYVSGREADGKFKFPSPQLVISEELPNFSLSYCADGIV